MAGGKPVTKNRITSFFKPATKETPKSTKRALPEEYAAEHTRRRSKSPKISTQTSPLPIRTDSPRTKRVDSPLSRVSDNVRKESPSKSAALTPSDSESDIIVLAVPPRKWTTTTSSKFDQYPAASTVNQSFTSSGSSSSHRVERNGQTVITGSDDDDSDDLLDLNKLLDRKPVQQGRIVSKQEIQSPRPNIRKKTSSKYVDTSKEDAVDFENLLEQTKKDLTSHQHSKEAISLAKTLDSELRTSTNQQKPLSEITAESITERVANSDREKAEKFAQAIERTELTHTTQRWSFFGADTTNAKVLEEADPATPKTSTPKKRMVATWPQLKTESKWSVYRDPTLRESAILAGVFEQAAIDRSLPEELFLWIMQQSFFETDSCLREVYQSILKLSDKSISSDQAITYLKTNLQLIGAKDESICSTEAIRKFSANPSEPALLSNVRDVLRGWLRNAGILCSNMSISDHTKLLKWLLTMTLDSAISTDTQVLLELRRTLCICMEGFTAAEQDKSALNTSMRYLFQRAGDIQSRLQCLQVLPATSPKLYSLRQRLALATFFEDPLYLDREPTPTFLAALCKHLNRDAAFQMTKRTDYRRTAAHMACLDIAIGDGGRLEAIKQSTARDFNLVVDSLTQTVQMKFARIQANGAAHISRTEAKDILEAIDKRLRFTVRTKQKHKSNIYDQSSLDGIFRQQ